MKFTAALSILALATPAAAFSASYLENISGGSPNVPTSSQGSYLDGLKSGSTAAAPSSGFGMTSYLDSVSGNAPPAAAPPSGFGMTSYLDSVSGNAPPAAAVEAAPAEAFVSSFGSSEDAVAVPAGEYLGSLTGSGSAMSGSGPVGYLDELKTGSAAPPSGFGMSTYLDSVSGNAPPAPAAEAAPTEAFVSSFGSSEDAVAASAGDYLGSLTGSSSDVNGSGPQGYLDTLPPQPSTSGAGFTGYLDALRVEAFTPVVVAPTTYIENLAGAVTVTQNVAATTEYTNSAEANAPVLAAINKLNENMMANQKATIGILQDINSSVQTLVEQAESRETSSYAEPTELTSALEGSRAYAQAWAGQAWNP